MFASFLITQCLFFTIVWGAFTPPPTSTDRAAVLQSFMRNDTSSGASKSSGLEAARELVLKGHRAMAALNEDIINNPSSNLYEVLNSTELGRARRPAPFLDYESNASLQRRQASNGTTRDRPRSYRVPEELVEAARLLAEATPIEADSGTDLREKHASIKAGRLVQDTHAMGPMLKRPNGLQTEVISDPPELFRFGSNNTATTSRVSQPRMRKRAEDEEWWMAKIQQRGASPYAPSGYKVWRNVKDYGATGNGRTDDTAAINRAISDGGRCGDGCGGSTVYPATVYFPPGDYVVSSSIIQYYNTEILGHPFDEPRIIAAPSFVGLGVITTNVFREDGTEWYLNSNNVLRSIRNLVIDIRYAPSDAYVCGLHWQVAQGTSLENVAFWQEWTMDTTQQGIYAENGSGGLLADLYFWGGAFGAYMGSQQFTANGLYFENMHQAALQVHWDYGWTINDVQWYNVRTGIKLTGGRGGYLGSEQAVGALMVTDALGQHMDAAITSTLVSENSTSFLIQNAMFADVEQIVVDDHTGRTLLDGDGGDWGLTVVESWGFGRVYGPFDDSDFVNGDDVYVPPRHASLTVEASLEDMPHDLYFSRRRPRYSSLGSSQVLDVRELGAKGDGVTDDAAVLNHIFSAAANMSAIVYVPYGVYLVKDTVNIPVGSRIIGQAWPQIMGTDARFENMNDPRPVVRVGRTGNQGVIEMQSLLFTVRGPASGAVLLEWNVHQSFQGSAGLWDCHFRAGGAEGSGLQSDQCSKQSGAVRDECVAAALMLHITRRASAYLENVWIWTADHDIDDPDQGQLDIYTGRGVLIESGGPTWLWGVSAEHSTLYQFQVSGASHVLLGLVQTQNPFFQPEPNSVEVFREQMGAFSNDPTFEDCDNENGGASDCAAAWGARISDSRSIYMLSVNLYAWFQKYDPTCIDSGRHDCQQKILFAEQSTDIWLFNLVTIGAVEMISPLGGIATLASENRAANYVTASIMAWLGGADQTAGPREFDGFRVHGAREVALGDFNEACSVALATLVKCDDHTATFREPGYRGALHNQTLVNSVCAPSCKKSIDQWVSTVETLCGNSTWDNGAAVEYVGGFIQAGIEEQCHRESSSNRYCNDVIEGFTSFQVITELPREELCSECYLGRLQMMQASKYSVYRTATFYQDALAHAVTVCGLQGQPTDAQPPAVPPPPTPDIWCQSGVTYTTVEGDTCDSMAKEFSVSSASIFYGNPDILDCKDVLPGVEVCMPLECLVYEVQPNDDCVGIQTTMGIQMLDLMINNPWITHDCGNLHTANYTLGNVLCLTVPGGVHDDTSDNPNADPSHNQYTNEAVAPPTGSVIAENTTMNCGRWHVATAEDNCATVTGRWITVDLFRMVNPSIKEGDCSSSIEAGKAYCTGPTYTWNSREFQQYGNETYFGCFAPVEDDGLVLRGDLVEDDERMALKPCSSYCNALGFAYFGIRNGDTCFCDDKLNMNVVSLDASECQSACTGDRDGDDACGGTKGVSVYSFHDVLYRRYVERGCFPAVVFGGEPMAVTGDMERQRCSLLCLEKHAYFGLARGNECYCGDDVRGTSEADSGSCDTRCAGDALEMCGADAFMTVYSSLSLKESEE